MSGVRRGAVRAGGRHRRLWAALLLLLILLLIALALYLMRREPALLPAIEREEPVVLIDREEEELSSITIANPYDAPYTLVNTAEGWQMEGMADFVFRESMLDSIVINACFLQTAETVLDTAEEEGLTAADFGLEEGCTRVSVRFTDGSECAFRIGSPVYSESDTASFYYLMLEGDSRVFTVEMDVWDAYTNTRMALHEVGDPALNGELIDRITFTGENAFTAEKRADGWYMTAPFVYPLSDSAMETLLEKIEKVRFAQYVGRAAEYDLAACGLDTPRRVMTLDIAKSVVTGYDDKDEVVGEKVLPAYQLTFEIGGDDSEVAFFCQYRDDIVKISRFSANFMLEQTYEELLLTAPANAPTNDLLAFAWKTETQEKRYTFELVERLLENNEFETDENGNVLHDLQVFRDGAPCDAAAFLYAYRSLVELHTVRRLPQGYAVQGTPRLMVTLTRSASVRTLAFYPYDALHEAVMVDGVALYYVEKGWDAGLEWP